MLLAILAFAPASAAFGQANDAQPPAGLKVTVSSISDKVRQYQQAEARVTVENAALVPLTIHEVVVEPSAELRVCPSFTSPPAKGSDGCEAQEKPEPLTIGPGDAKVLRWVITVPDRSSASKHPISFEIDYGDHPARTAVATTTIDMTAIGDTGVLDILKVSFLILPGFLAVTVFYLLASARTKQALWVKQLAPNNAQTWVVAVLLSFAAVPVYPHLPGGRNVLSGYAAGDLVVLTAWSVGFGIVAYLMYLVVDFLVGRGLAAYVRDRTPGPGDDPVAVLHKLSRKRPLGGGVPAHRQLTFPQVRIGDGETTLQLFKLADAATDPPSCWVCPPIEVDRQRLGNDWSALETAIAADQGKAAADALGGAPPGTVGWAATGSWAGPELVPKTKLDDSRRLPARRIIEEQGP
ncbi:MAG TPA: hypothetical protein VFA94_08930 [Acidimicrobiales bacterium]|nr:hypothetical protein [Acidimicrobiales bacterium]